MTIALAHIPTESDLRLNFSIATELGISAQQAKRLVVRYCMAHLSLFVSPETPSLFIQDEQTVYWRFPLELTIGRRGKLGQIGMIDVDAMTGELCVSEKLTQEWRINAERLATSPVDSTIT